jgi:hypothetical protein
MEFSTYNQLRDYTAEWLSEDETQKIWNWLQKGMIANEQIVNITKDCCCNRECYINTTEFTAWQTFLNTHNYSY